MDDIENGSGKRRIRKKNTGNDIISGKGQTRFFFLKFFSFVFFVAAVSLGFMYYKTSNELNVIKNPEKQKAVLDKKINNEVSELAKFLVINNDDKPIFAGIVEDPELLKKEQVFFADASFGDYVFIFEKTNRAMIWNPTNKMIVNFGVYSQAEKQNKDVVSNDVDEEDTDSTEKN